MMLAEQIAKSLDLPLIQWHIKSTTKAQVVCTSMTLCPDCETRSSAMIKSKTSQLHHSGKDLAGLSIGKQAVLLIDEIDKGHRVPNDLVGTG